MKRITNFKRGAASFYIVAISTLILVIIAASFAAVIISEVTRTSNDDLAQSAYDSALAGVEDAKLTLYNYQKCKNGEVLDSNISCSQLMEWIDHGTVPTIAGQELNSCDVVAHSLNRTVERNPNNANEELGVSVKEGNTSNNMQQYYSCVKIATQTQDLLGQLNSTEPEHSFRIRFSGGDSDMQAVNKIRLNWHSSKQDSDRVGFDYMDLKNSNKGAFEDKVVTPAVISLGIVQTANSFSLNSFDKTEGNTTNRGTVYFIPTKEDNLPNSEKYIYKNNTPVTAQEGFLKSNNKGSAVATGNTTDDKSDRNVPFAVKCSDASQDYVCSTEVELPMPVGNNRNSDTFVVSVALPYGQPKTEFSLEFFAGDRQLTLDGVQISVDSTGRANDLFRRVDSRLEPADASYPFPIYGIQAIDEGQNPSIWKEFYTTCEYNFADVTASNPYADWCDH